MVVKIVSRVFDGCSETGKHPKKSVATMTYLAVPGEAKKTVGQVWAKMG
jgi:hypothetical protein